MSCIPVALIALTLTSAAPPEPSSALEAMTRLKRASGATLVSESAAVEAACRGKLRHELRDHAGLYSEVERRLNEGSDEEKKAVLDLERCFTAEKLAPLLVRALGDKSPAVVAFAAEIMGRFEDGRFVAPLLEALAARQALCSALAAGAGPETEPCVWIVYALGPSGKAADASGKANVASGIEPYARSAHPKLKEVATATLKSAKKK